MPTAAQVALIEGPGGGVITHRDPRHVPDQAWVNCRNVRFPTGGSRIRKTDGYARVDSSMPAEPIRAIWLYQQTTAVPPIGGAFIRVMLTRANAHLGSGQFAITPTTYKPATIDDVVTITAFAGEADLWAGGSVIWADGGANPVMFWNGAGPGTAAPLFPGGKPNGKLIEIHKNRLLLGNVTDTGIAGVGIQPWRVIYSAPGHPEDVTADTAGDLDFLEDTDPLIAIKVLGDAVIVHKPSRLYRMIAIGGPEPYQIEQIPADDGAIAARAAISIGSYQYFMGRSNIYRLASFTEPIGDAVWPEIEKNADWSKVHLIYAYRRQEYDEVCWKIPQLGGASDLSVVFNYRDQSWTFTDHDPGTCYTEFPQVPWLRPTAVSSLPPVVGVFGQMNGNIQAYDTVNADGLPIHAWAESKHFQAGLFPAKVLAVACYASGTGHLAVGCRAAMDLRQPMPAWKPGQILSLTPSQTRPWVDVREYGRLWQVRLESTQLNDDWEVAAYGPAVIMGGYAR
jgi:hypothetical protein